jgi:hypothetical protein
MNFEGELCSTIAAPPGHFAKQMAVQTKIMLRDCPQILA